MTHVVTPSRPETFPQVWHGTAGGCRGLTIEQAITVRRERQAPETVTLIRINGVGGEFTCPRLALSRDERRMLIVTPNGEKMWLDAGRGRVWL